MAKVNANYEVVYIMDPALGEEAIAAVQGSSASQRPYDVLYLDWQMPGLDGFETAQRIRALTPVVPVSV